MIISSIKKNKKIKKYESTELFKEDFAKTNKREFVAPLNPTKIVAIGLNYFDHAEEMRKKPPEEPLLFYYSNQ